METLKKAIAFLGVLAGLIGLIYLAGVGYYSNKFAANTSYNYINIGNLTLSQAQDKVEEVLIHKEITLLEDGTPIRDVQVADLDPTFDLNQGLEALYYSQNPNQWYEGFYPPTTFASELKTDISLDAEALADQLNQDTRRESAVNAQILYSEDQGYYVEPGQEGSLIDPESLEKAIATSLQSGKNHVDLEEAYQQPDLTEEDEGIQKIMDQIEALTSTEIRLNLADEEIVIPAQRIEEWIYFDANNQLVINQEKVAEDLRDLNEDYATFNKTRQFMSTMQGEVTVMPGTLGWGIDVDAETSQIAEDLLAGQDVHRDAIVYSTGGIAGAADDIGSTYVEVDLSYQMMFLYYDGVLITSTPIVSGQTGTETIPGAGAVNQMLVNTELKGYNPRSQVRYSTPVSYWIQFDYNAQGIHDASWQGTFGGETWRYNGSLGCINTPIDQAALIYQHVDIGTPVIVFY